MSATLYRSWFALLCVSCIYAGSAPAQSYPFKPIRIIIPYAPGGGADVLFRFLAPPLSENLGQQVVVDNRPGGAATIGVDMVAKSKPDGYTLGMASLSFVANPFMVSKMPYDTEKDLMPVSLVATSPLVLAVHPSVPARSVKQLIALAKAKPGSLNYASGGNAASNHLGTELFKYMTGVNMTHVPYKGGGPAVLSIVSGETMILFATIPSSLQHFKSGKLVGLGISTSTRFPTLPDIPTVAEAGVPGFDMYEWQGLVVPAGTPAAVISRLHREIAKALALPEMKERILGLGELAVGSTPEEFAIFIKGMLATWSKVVKTAGIRID
ncbi:MAG: tripartite tricarboxylate transporter substrate binding protein [Betaproteobacteria bacterium]|nr:tripartite tricarboxylate transporter substrate binding protein [Betaproteobacteria bacterium]